MAPRHIRLTTIGSRPKSHQGLQPHLDCIGHTAENFNLTLLKGVVDKIYDAVELFNAHIRTQGGRKP